LHVKTVFSKVLWKNCAAFWLSMDIRKTIVGVLAAFAAAVPAFAQGAGQIASTDRYVASVKKITGSAKQPKIVVADTAAYDARRPLWRKFASEKALEKFREARETYTIAFNWKSGGRLVASNFTTFSPSGDWTQYTFHFFREDGSLAKVEGELRTFYGDYIVRRTYYFSPEGRVVSSSVRYFDLVTGKPKRPADGVSEMGSWTYYTTVGKLPFASLVK
jgi:hypothetical protein